MSNIAVLGCLFGDEGKGRIVHYLAKDFKWVVRFNGGANAGHTIYRDINGKRTKFIHNLLPSFDWTIPDQNAFLGQGMVIDLEQLFNEIYTAEQHRFSIYGQNFGSIAKRVYVDPEAFAVLPKHIEEDKKKNGHIGSTNRGIGPAYKDKVGRSGSRIRDLLKQENEFAMRLKDMGVQFETAMEVFQGHPDNVLFEGAQGTMIDLNHGVYPYVSCSDTTIGGIYSSGFAHVRLDRVYGVTKAYMTKVGEGPFPTEQFGEEADKLRERGQEYGATTGRPRRIGWLDLPMLQYATARSGVTHLIVTKMDILYGMEWVKVCTAYDKRPVSPSDFENAKPQYIEFPGWTNADSKEADYFLYYIGDISHCEVSYVSCGVGDEDIIKRAG